MCIRGRLTKPGPPKGSHLFPWVGGEECKRRPYLFFPGRRLVHDPFVMAQEAAAQLVQPMLKAKPAKKAKVAALKPQSQPVAKRKPSPKPSISNKRGRHKTQLQAPPPPPPPAPPPSRDRLAIDDAAEPATESASAASPPLAPTASCFSEKINVEFRKSNVELGNLNVGLLDCNVAFAGCDCMWMYV